MNERIRELVKKAGGHFHIHNLTSNPVQHKESIELWDDRIEKFTELIVQECIAVIEAAKPGVDQLPSDVALTITANNVRAYFGVK